MYKFSDDTIETLDVKLGTLFPELQGKWSKEFGTLRYEFIKASAEKQKIILKALVNNIKSTDLLQMIGEHVDALNGRTDTSIITDLNSIAKSNGYRDPHIFSITEALIAGDIVSTKVQKTFQRICNNFYRVSGDLTYKLFADYSNIYSSKDTDKLENIIYELREGYKNSKTWSDKYSFLYLLCLCNQRITLNRYKGNLPVGRMEVEGTYGCAIKRDKLYIDECFEKESQLAFIREDPYDYKYIIDDYGSYSEAAVALDFEQVISQGYFAICRLFVTDYHYFDRKFEDQLADKYCEIKQATKYNNRGPILLSEKMSFCRYTA